MCIEFFNSQVDAMIPAGPSYTWDDVATNFYQFFNDNLRTTGLYIERVRLDEMAYFPISSGNLHQQIVINMNRVKIHMILESSLKVQNRTVTTVAQDESVDVNNVPLSGRIYHCKGNNLFDRGLRKILTSPAAGTQASVDLFLYERVELQTAAYPAALNGASKPTNDTQSTFNKPAQPPEPYQFLNCKSAAKVSIAPGEIQESKLKQTFALPLKVLINILLNDFASLQPVMTFNPQKGICRVMHLEKTVGSGISDVAVRTEVQWDCWCAATSTTDTKYTNPICVQVDINQG